MKKFFLNYTEDKLKLTFNINAGRVEFVEFEASCTSSLIETLVGSPTVILGDRRTEGFLYTTNHLAVTVSRVTPKKRNDILSPRVVEPPLLGKENRGSRLYKACHCSSPFGWYKGVR